MHLLIALLGGLLLAVGFLIAGGPLTALCGWLAAVAFSYIAARSLRPGFHLYLAGILAHLVGFHWLMGTISDFGGFPLIAAAPLFFLFAVISALQFLAAGWIARRLPAALQLVGLAFPLAWVVAEFLPIGIFPWAIGHTQLGFIPFAQIADIGGVSLISFVMVWVTSSALQWREAKQPALSALLLFTLSLSYGGSRITQFSKPVGPTQRIALVQANISIEEKHNIKSFAKNAARYEELSRSIDVPGTIIVWPETVLQEWISASIGHIYADPRLPNLTPKASLLIGALTYSEEDPKNPKMFNSALPIFEDGSVVAPYHKQILMPFGEYIPFSSWFPILNDLLVTAGNFTAGTEIKVFDFPVTRDGVPQLARVAPLICYEDMMPSLAGDAVRQGAEVLINLTNDAWFGNTRALFEHHLIASFRAIETRRFLARSTNSGLTAIVNPLGQTTSHIPQYSEGTILADVNLISYKSFYSHVSGDAPWWIITLLTLVLIVFRGPNAKV